MRRERGNSSYKFFIGHLSTFQYWKEKRALTNVISYPPERVGVYKTSHSGFVYCRYFRKKGKGRQQTGIDAGVRACLPKGKTSRADACPNNPAGIN